MEEKKLELKTAKNQKYLLASHKQLIMFMKNWKIIIHQIKGEC